MVLNLFSTSFARIPRFQLFEEIITLVINEDEGREILHNDFPDSFHAQSLESNAAIPPIVPR